MKHAVCTRAVYDPRLWDLEEAQRRLDLFRDVTAASLAAQTHPPDEWVLAVHLDDPLLAQRLEVAGDAGIPITTIWEDQNHPDRAVAAMRAYQLPWRSTLPPRDPTATTRLDDDDGLTPDAFERLHYVNGLAGAIVAPEAGAAVLMFPSGYRIHDGRFTRVRHYSNAMATLYTPAGDNRHIYEHRHRKAATHYPVVNIDLLPAWLWVRHPDTLSGWKAASKPIDREIRRMFPHIDFDALGSKPTGPAIQGGTRFR